jgi:predicted dehydrogenase
MKLINIGIISFEHMHAFSYAQTFSQISGARLKAVAETDPNRMERVKAHVESISTSGENLNGAALGVTYYHTYEALLADPEIDAVVICTNNADHRRVAEMAAAHKKHILCEKPLAPTIEDSQAIIDAAKAAGIILMTAFPVRFSPAITQARELIKTGELGAILGACTSNHGSMPGGWFVDAAKSGGGAVIDHTVHVVDVLRWMFDDEVESVHAEYATRLHDELKVEDVGQLLMKFKKGAIVSLDTSWSRPKSYSIWGDVKIALKGEKANLTINCFPRQINHFDDTKMRHDGTSMSEDLDQLMVQEFVNAVRENRQPLVTGEDGLKAVQIALAAYAAGRNGKAQHQHSNL